MSRSLDRRSFLIMSSAAASAAALTGCSALQLDPDTGDGQSGPPVDTSQKQAPMLQQLVDQGKLPDLAERLPENPLVVPMQQELGRYGGTMRRGQVDTGSTGGQYLVFAGLAEWSPTTPS